MGQSLSWLAVVLLVLLFLFQQHLFQVHHVLACHGLVVLERLFLEGQEHLCQEEQGRLFLGEQERLVLVVRGPHDLVELVLL